MQERKDNNDFALEEDIKAIGSFKKVVRSLEVCLEFKDRLEVNSSASPAKH